MILEVSWDGLWTLPFGLSQSHGHGSWLMCEVTLSMLLGIKDAQFKKRMKQLAWDMHEQTSKLFTF